MASTLIKILFIQSAIVAFAIVISQLTAILLQNWLVIRHYKNETNIFTISLWQVCIEGLSPTKSQSHSADCIPVDQFNGRYIDYQRHIEDFNDAHERLLNGVTSGDNDCTLTQSCLESDVHSAGKNCDALTAPYVAGSQMKNDSIYGFVRVHYQCVPGYKMADPYETEIFCKCNTSDECFWTTPVPTCLALDPCLPNGPESDICQVGSSIQLKEKSFKIINNLNVEDTQQVVDEAIYLFPQMQINCEGVIRQWDVVTANPGTVFIDIWTLTGSKLELVGTNRLDFQNTGLQAFIIPPDQRIEVGNSLSFVGVHFPSKNSATNKSAVLFTSTKTINGSATDFPILKLNGGGGDFKNQYNFDDFELSPMITVKPAIVGYVTSAAIGPINIAMLQAMPITSFLCSLTAFLAISLLCYLLTDHFTDRFLSRGKLQRLFPDANKWFDICSKLVDTSILCSLFCGIICIDGFFIFYTNPSKTCNNPKRWTIGYAGWVWLISGIVALLLPILLCISQFLFAKQFPNSFNTDQLPVERGKGNKSPPARQSIEEITNRISPANRSSLGDDASELEIGQPTNITRKRSSNTLVVSVGVFFYCLSLFYPLFILLFNRQAILAENQV